MLRSIQLENFKAFGQRTVIPLAPITLIFGQNSAGKSSILQALGLLKQTSESRDGEGVLLPRTANGFVDLGSFQEMLFDHDLDRRLVIRFDVTVDVDSEKSLRMVFPEATMISVEFHFLRRTLEEEVSLDKLSFLIEEEQIAEFRPKRQERSLDQLEPSTAIEFEEPRRAMVCKQVTESESFWSPLIEFAVDRSKQFPHLYRKDHFGSYDRSRIDEACRVFTSLSKPQLLRWFREEQIGSHIIMDSFLPAEIPFRGPLYFHRDRQTRRSKKEWPNLEDVAKALMLGDGYASLAQMAVTVGKRVHRELSALVPLGPYRTPAERHYIFSGTTPHDVGYHGHLLPDLLFRNPELVSSTNEWLGRLDIGYELRIQRLGSEMGDLFEIRLRDTRRTSEVLVGLPDVGFGVSQILPFVIQSLAGKGRLITIEQPEVHVHPRLQADLGDLLIEAIKEPQRNRFIVETHSEHLALRIQRRVREKKVSPTDVSILYVSRGSNGSTVQRLRLDNDGDFMDDWPDGYFPERLRELRR